MNSELRARFVQLRPIRGIDRVLSGSPAALVLRRPERLDGIRSIDAMLTLARRGISMLRAKRAIEELIAEGRVVLTLPTVEDAEAVTAELAKAGIEAATVTPKAVDVRDLRTRLGLTREQFAARYGMEVETVRNWETGKRGPDTTARSYLQAISNAPELVERAYAPTAPLRPAQP